MVVTDVLPSTLVASKRDCEERDDAGMCTQARRRRRRCSSPSFPPTLSPSSRVLSIEGPTTYDSHGQVLFVTVRNPN